MNWRLDIEYDGSAYRGWAKQDGGVDTVQARIEFALETALRKSPIPLTVAGRTDAGVHALGQVASFEFDGEMPEKILRSLNGLTPHSISIRALTPAPEFDARHDAISRSYCYRILTRRPDSPFAIDRAWWISRPIDQELLHACAAKVLGKHDFTAFTPTDTYHTRFHRVISTAEWSVEGGLLGADTLQFRITGDSFMKNMVRILVGTMIEVADGSRSLENFERLLQGAVRFDAGITAPPQGLYFVGVEYGEGAPTAVSLPG